MQDQVREVGVGIIFRPRSALLHYIGSVHGNISLEPRLKLGPQPNARLRGDRNIKAELLLEDGRNPQGTVDKQQGCDLAKPVSVENLPTLLGRGVGEL